MCFLQVLCVGTETVFIDNANEQHNMILLKHFTEKNHAVVVDVKTRKRKTGSVSSQLGVDACAQKSAKNQPFVHSFLAPQ